MRRHPTIINLYLIKRLFGAFAVSKLSISRTSITAQCHIRLPKTGEPLKSTWKSVLMGIVFR